MRGSRSWKRIRRHDDGWLEFSRVGQAGQQLPPTDQTGPGPYSGQECAFSWVRRELPKRDGLVGWKAKTPPDSLHADHRDLQTARSCWRYRVQAESKALLSCKRRSISVTRTGLVGTSGGCGDPPLLKQAHLTFFCSSGSSYSASPSLQPFESTTRSNNSLYRMSEQRPKASKAWSPLSEGCIISGIHIFILFPPFLDF